MIQSILVGNVPLLFRIERSAITDQKVPRNINVSLTNNAQAPVDALIFIFYSDEFVIDVETGIIRK